MIYSKSNYMFNYYLNPKILMKKCTFTLLLLMAFFFFGNSSLLAQKFNNLDPVKYDQLPSQGKNFSTVLVYILQEKDDANEALAKGFTKLSNKVDNTVIREGMDAFAKEVLSNKQEKYDVWNLFPNNFSAEHGNGTLKVVIAYLPDQLSKPMGEPMKNKDGEHVFNYRVKTKMMLYNESGELLLKQDFGAISGRAASKTWPENAGGSVAFGVTVSEDNGQEDRHPYDEACIEGALDFVQRVVYGMYGVKEFTMPMKVMWAKSSKDSKKLANDYEDIIKAMKDTKLSADEMTKMKSLAEKWENVLNDVDNEEKWAIHYDIAAAYSWLLNPEKSKEHIAEVKKLNNDIFDKITNASGNWGTKDLKTLEAYNNLYPFAEYYAAGIRANSSAPAPAQASASAPKLPYFVPGVSIARSVLISKSLRLPAPMPVYPMQEADVKKASALIRDNTGEIANINYKYSKSSLLEVQVRGENEFDKLKQDYELPDNSDNHPSHMHSFKSKCGNSSLGADVFRNNENEFELSGEFICAEAFPIFEAEGVNQEYSFQTGTIKVITKNGFYEEVALSSSSEWGFKNVINKEEYSVDIESGDYKEIFRVTKYDKNGFPSEITADYVVNDARISVHANIKTKFGEETSKENARQRAANKEAFPVAKNMLMEMANANGASVDKGSEEGHYTFKLTKTYKVKVEANASDMWTKINIGDYELSREIK